VETETIHQLIHITIITVCVWGGLRVLPDSEMLSRSGVLVSFAAGITIVGSGFLGYWLISDVLPVELLSLKKFGTGGTVIMDIGYAIIIIGFINLLRLAYGAHKTHS